jgi:hypothetical protein
MLQQQLLNLSSQQYMRLPTQLTANMLATGAAADQEALVDGVKGLLVSSTWEHKIGGLMAAKVSMA